MQQSDRGQVYTAGGLVNKPFEKDFLALVERTSLVGHVACPDEIAKAYLFCMQCENRTGTTIDVEGGRLRAQRTMNDD
ncbi:hypothetical protein CALCODRAFT_520866 [Calocera cornea HHB12733]|uniref:NAD(P)-binding protein n=1 Tax=Calocera cornea HHB12733 TaxID=1353952 RepID=A0A165D7B9_9BASI|nr:hypothetical protein CALCODRAFT_520866 [Calocera cornea HHB12733]